MQVSDRHRNKNSVYKSNENQLLDFKKVRLNHLITRDCDLWPVSFPVRSCVSAELRPLSKFRTRWSRDRVYPAPINPTLLLCLSWGAREAEDFWLTDWAAAAVKCKSRWKLVVAPGGGGRTGPPPAPPSTSAGIQFSSHASPEEPCRLNEISDRFRVAIPIFPSSNDKYPPDSILHSVP